MYVENKRDWYLAFFFHLFRQLVYDLTKVKLLGDIEGEQCRKKP